MNKISAKKIFQIKEEIKSNKERSNSAVNNKNYNFKLDKTRPKSSIEFAQKNKKLVKNTVLLKDNISKKNKKAANISIYIKERNKIIEEENNLFLSENDLDNTKKINNFHTNIVKILNKKIDCIEKFCNNIKGKYKP